MAARRTSCGFSSGFPQNWESGQTPFGYNPDPEKNLLGFGSTPYSKYLKASIKSGECLVHLDFAESYSFVVQDAVQSFFWTKSQATIHPVCAYYLDESGNVAHKSFGIITIDSDHLTNDTNAAHFP